MFHTEIASENAKLVILERLDLQIFPTIVGAVGEIFLRKIFEHCPKTKNVIYDPKTSRLIIIQDSLNYNISRVL